VNFLSFFTLNEIKKEKASWIVAFEEQYTTFHPFSSLYQTLMTFILLAIIFLHIDLIFLH